MDKQKEEKKITNAKKNGTGKKEKGDNTNYYRQMKTFRKIMFGK